MNPNIVVTKTPTLGSSSSVAASPASSIPTASPSSNLSTGSNMHSGINLKSTNWGKMGMYAIGIIILAILGLQAIDSLPPPRLLQAEPVEPAINSESFLQFLTLPYTK